MADADFQELVDTVATRCMAKMQEERARADEAQLEQINQLLEHWSGQSFAKTKELVATISAAPSVSVPKPPPQNGANELSGDIKDRQNNLLSVF
jgi:hypothetical protein